MSEKTLISYKRHVMKTITWRLVGTIDTILIGWIISGPINRVKNWFCRGNN